MMLSCCVSSWCQKSMTKCRIQQLWSETALVCTTNYSSTVTVIFFVILDFIENVLEVYGFTIQFFYELLYCIVQRQRCHLLSWAYTVRLKPVADPGSGDTICHSVYREEGGPTMAWSPASDCLLYIHMNFWYVRNFAQPWSDSPTVE